MTGVALDPAVVLVLRLLGAAVLGGAALHKLRNGPGFRAALAGYGLLPGWALAPVAGALAGAEAVLAAAFLWPPTAPAAGLAAAGLVGLYAGAVAAALARGHAGRDCGCGGPAGDLPLGPALLVRNAALALAFAAAALPAAPRALVWLDAVTAVAAAGLGALLLAGAEQALANAARASVARSAR